MSCSCITFQFPGIYAIYLVVHTWDIHLFKLKNTMEQQGTSKALKSFEIVSIRPHLRCFEEMGF